LKTTSQRSANLSLLILLLVSLIFAMTAGFCPQGQSRALHVAVMGTSCKKVVKLNYFFN